MTRTLLRKWSFENFSAPGLRSGWPKKCASSPLALEHTPYQYWQRHVLENYHKGRTNQTALHQNHTVTQAARCSMTPGRLQ